MPFYILLLIILPCYSQPSTANVMPAGKAKAPYEATWLGIQMTNNGYVILNYPSLRYGVKTKSPWICRAERDSMTWITYSDEPMAFKYNEFDEVVKLSDSSYEFKSKRDNNFRFDYVDKANHIAQWRIYYDSYGKLQDEGLYVDSLYNTFPIVDIKWKEESIDGEDD